MSALVYVFVRNGFPVLLVDEWRHVAVRIDAATMKALRAGFTPGFGHFKVREDTVADAARRHQECAAVMEVAAQDRAARCTWATPVEWEVGLTETRDHTRYVLRGSWHGCSGVRAKDGEHVIHPRNKDFLFVPEHPGAS